MFRSLNSGMSFRIGGDSQIRPQKYLAKFGELNAGDKVRKVHRRGFLTMFFNSTCNVASGGGPRAYKYAYSWPAG